MRLTRIEIENFKGIGERQTLELAPITLLFGPNSAGKSTILQALQYVRAILEGENPDPDPYVDSGDVDYGGFKNLVHGHDLSKEIYIGLTIDLTDDDGSSILNYSLGDSIDEIEFAKLRLRYLAGGSEQIQSLGVGLQISWSEQAARPYISSTHLEFNKERIAGLVSTQHRRGITIEHINYSHPLLWPESDPNYVADDDDPGNNPLWNELFYFHQHQTGEASIWDMKPLNYSGLPGALANIDRSLQLFFHPSNSQLESEGDDESASVRVRGLNWLMDDLILGPVRVVRHYLRSLVHIGPIREIPDRTYQPTRSLSPWFRGRAAWDLLYSDDSEELLEDVNNWISREDRLATGYEIVNRTVREVPIPGVFDQFFERNLEEDDLPELKELYTSLKLVRVVKLRDLANNIYVIPFDVGVGISQVIPVVVACCADRSGLIAVEQPELHIHPKIQVELGDLLINTTAENAEKSLLMETHSEHMLLRLLRRIQETTEGELPPGVGGLDRFDLSVIYAHPTEDGVKFKKLRVNPDGEFRDRWPEGFFGERSEELF